MILIDASGRERRIDERQVIDLTGTVRAYRVGPYRIRLIDVSPGGAMIALDGSLVVRGDEVLLAAGGIELVSTIAWTAEQFCGLAFHRRLSAAEMASWRRASRIRPGAAPRSATSS